MIRVQKDNAPRKILLIQLRRIGDVVMTLPAAGVIRKLYPDAQIDFLVEPPADELARLNPHLTQTLVYDKAKSWDWINRVRREKYDAVLDFLSNGRTVLLSALSGAPLRIAFDGPFSRKIAYNRLVENQNDGFIVDKKIGLIKALAGLSPSFELKWNWDLKIPRDQIAKAQQLLAARGVSGPVIGFAPAHIHLVRAWRPEGYAEVGAALVREGFGILLLGGPGEGTYLDSIAACIGPKAVAVTARSLAELGALLSRCRLLIANDNGPQKIAMALDIPTLTIFGPTGPQTLIPAGERHQALRDDQLFCIGCELNTCPYHHECMQNISAERVLREAHALLGRNGGRGGKGEEQTAGADSSAVTPAKAGVQKRDHLDSRFRGNDGELAPRPSPLAPDS